LKAAVLNIAAGVAQPGVRIPRSPPEPSDKERVKAVKGEAVIEESDLLKDPGYVLKSPYDKNFLEAFKELVPADSREWFPSTGQWWFSEEFLDEVEQLCSEFFERVIVR
jgi:hypothetical protein